MKAEGSSNFHVCTHDHTNVSVWRFLPECLPTRTNERASSVGDNMLQELSRNSASVKCSFELVEFARPPILTQTYGN